MKPLTTILTTLVLLASTGTVTAQASGSVSPNNVDSGETTTVTLEGLPANETIKVIFSGVGQNGTEVNVEREVTTDAQGEVSWTETVDWDADTYATNVSWRIGSGQPTNTATGDLTVNP